jgi:cell division septal protein FtsQ
VVSFELLNNDLLKTITDSGVVIIFSRKSFQVQLERLEDFISFELNSGKLEDIRNIDLRYKNAIAVKYI